MNGRRASSKWPVRQRDKSSYFTYHRLHQPYAKQVHVVAKCMLLPSARCCQVHVVAKCKLLPRAHCYANTMTHTIMKCDRSFPSYKMVNPWLFQKHRISPWQLIIASLDFTLGCYNLPALGISCISSKPMD